MDYLNKYLKELADSVIKPIWQRVLTLSWGLRATILVTSIAIAAAIAHPEPFIKYYEIANYAAYAIRSSTHNIHLDASAKSHLASTRNRLKSTIKADLSTLDTRIFTPWSTAQALAAYAIGEHKPLKLDKIANYIRSNETNSCFCWSEYPDRPEDGVCSFISGWILTAFAEAQENVSAEEISSVLSDQQTDGWWPLFKDKKEAEYASTYATAWNLIGLEELSKRNLVPPAMREQVSDSIDRASAWLLRASSSPARWKPYPILSNSTESDSISGLVIHALHLNPDLNLEDIDNEWISRLPAEPSDPADATGLEKYYFEMQDFQPQRVDHFVQIKLPWMIVATTDAYRNSGFLNKGIATKWLDSAVEKHGTINADAGPTNWWRSEMLFSLNYLNNNAK